MKKPFIRRLWESLWTPPDLSKLGQGNSSETPILNPEKDARDCILYWLTDQGCQSPESALDNLLEFCASLDLAIDTSGLFSWISQQINLGYIYTRTTEVGEWMIEYDPPRSQDIQIPQTQVVENQQCQRCQNYHGQTYGRNKLICAIHPYGPSEPSCPDLRLIPPTSQKFIEDYPRAVEKLIFWAWKRAWSCQFPFDYEWLNGKGREIVFNYVKDYLRELLDGGKDCLITKQRLDELRTELSFQEKSLIARFMRESVRIALGIDKDSAGEEYKPICREIEAWGALEYTVLREPLIQRLSLHEIVTQNSYDAAILNSDRIMIVDVDMFGPPEFAISKAHALIALESLSKEMSLTFRAYQTAAGLRYICTNRFFDPSSDFVQVIFTNLFCDSKYAKLCKFQETFRARLSPKPWRSHGLVGRYQGGRQWLDSQPSDLSVCAFLYTCGYDDVLPEIVPVIDFHDQITGVSRAVFLA